MDGRIVIVDDEPITRLDIRDIVIEAGYEVVGEAADGFEAIEVCKNTTRSSINGHSNANFRWSKSR